MREWHSGVKVFLIIEDMEIGNVWEFGFDAIVSLIFWERTLPIGNSE